MGTVPAGTDPMFSSLFLTAVVLARFYHRNHKTLPVTGFGNGSGSLSVISESVFHRKKQLITAAFFVSMASSLISICFFYILGLLNFSIFFYLLWNNYFL